jgi:5-formyltetrahydrofolate cyclo-ligase
MTDALGKDKELLRDQARTTGCPLTKRLRKKRLICRRLLELLDGHHPLMVYASKPREVNTKVLIRHLISRGKTVIVPIIEKDTKTLRLSFLRDPDLSERYL